MRDWSGRLSEHSTAWVFSLLLHAVLFLLIRGWAMAPLVPYGEGAVEVMLIGGLPGGGGASDREPTGREKSEGGKVANAAVKAKAHPKGELDPQPSPFRTKQPASETSAPSSLAKVEPVRGPRVVPPPLEISDAEFSDPVSLDDAQGDRTPAPSSAGTAAGPGGQEKATAADGKERRVSGVRGGDGPRSRVGEGEGDDLGWKFGGEGSGLGTGTGLGTGAGQGRSGDWRRALLQRIERAKRYPPQARRWGMEGTAEVQFRIAGDGSVEAVTVVKSSGFALLDRASVETIKRAAPLPAVMGTIRVPISYRLRDAQ